MRRKIVSGVLVLLILLANLPPGLATSELPQLTIHQPAELPLSGDEFDISVEVTDNPGLRAVQFSVVFDNDAFECLSIRVGSLPDGALSADNTDNDGAATVAIASLDAIQGDGVLATVRFRAKTDVKGFDFRLSDITLSDGDSKPIKCRIGETVSGAALPDKTPETADDAEKTESPSTPEESAGKPTGEDTPASFSDTSGHWGESYIARSAELGLFRGYPDGSFRPDEKVSRAQFVTVLWRAMGSPQPTEEAPFEDIDDQIEEFKLAIRWAYESGKVRGTSDTTFKPDKPLTRQEALTILHRCESGGSGAEMMFSKIYDDAFVDSGQIAPWAKEAMYWGVYHEIISGTGEKTLSPNTDTTRAQLAKIMVGYLDRFPKTIGQGGESK